MSLEEVATSALARQFSPGQVLKK
jgi:serine/threonine protein kinase